MTDEELAAELKKCFRGRSAHQPVGELLARHRGAVLSYATQYTSGPQHAGMLTTAAFTRVFEESLRQSGPTAAWRPHLLVTVRRIAEEWDTSNRRTMLHPGLRSGPEVTGRAAARLLPADDRKIVSRAFHGLPERARCILWHAEVEAEGLAAPAALLGITPEYAAVKATRARALLRDACMRAHQETAPDEECRRFSRLLDVSLRRGDLGLDPDLRQHLAGCPHCRYGADQLDHSGGRPAVLLAEAVLGWGAGAYLDSRPGRGKEAARAAGGADSWVAEGGAMASGGAPGGPAGSAAAAGRAPHPPAGSAGSAGSAGPVGSVGWGDGYPRGAQTGRPAPSTGPRHAARTGSPGVLRSLSCVVLRGVGARRLTRRQQVALTALMVSGCVLASLALTSAGGSEPVSRLPSGAATSTAGAPGTQPSGIGAGVLVSGPLDGRLRNADNGLCAGVQGTKAVAGTEVVLTMCTSSVRQQWSYDTGGLLRSLADTELCLDSRPGPSARLGSCADPALQGRVRYDLTLDGGLLPRGGLGLTLTPSSAEEGATLLLKELADGNASQQWAIDNSVESVQIESVSRVTDGSTAAPEPATPAPPPHRHPPRSPAPPRRPRPRARPTPRRTRRTRPRTHAGPTPAGPMDTATTVPIPATGRHTAAAAGEAAADERAACHGRGLRSPNLTPRQGRCHTRRPHRNRLLPHRRTP
ncbi:ricin-type beta-trefoil lectin domain protein [Streptomyces sp. KM273126]|uniref:ricin-type beta-trefoil lectin domain protein n=1 Tax=Streptomyces sp. KM273126 TaxID=2545247 RepID=UPI002867E7F8|nr:ricin-type beta-trefoil lectin domain protein [Streptomyces sp. KM273126]